MELSKENMKKIIIIICSIILFFMLLKNIKVIFVGVQYVIGICFPFILGLGIAFIVNLPMKHIEKALRSKIKNAKMQKLIRPLAYLITLILIFGVIILALFVVIPDLTDTIAEIIKVVPPATEKLFNYLMKKTADIPEIKAYVAKLDFNWGKIFETVVDWIQSGAMGALNTGIGFISQVISSVVSFIVGFIFSIYVLFQKENLSRQLKKVLYASFSERTADGIIYIGTLSAKTFSNFFSGQCLESVILGSMFVITLTIFNIPYALLIGVVIALTALIPIVGAFIGLVLGALLIVMVNPMQALIFIIIFLVIQQIEGNLIYPHVVGNSVGLPSIWVLVAVTVGGSLMGILGMIIFIPICSVVYTLTRQTVTKILERKNIPSEKWMNPMVLDIEESGGENVQTDSDNIENEENGETDHQEEN